MLIVYIFLNTYKRCEFWEIFKIVFYSIPERNLWLRLLHITCTTKQSISLIPFIQLSWYLVILCKIALKRKCAKFEIFILNTINFITPIHELFDHPSYFPRI